MDQETIISALVLGIVEGLTEFIPVSSTGHILLLGHFLGFENTGKIFEVLIQLGAILAILTLYFYRLWNVAMTLPTSAKSRQFVIGVLIAFMPAVVIGLMAHEIIKTVLFESPMLICVMLIIGGFILLWVDKKASKMTPKYTNAMEYPLWLCLIIGLFQCIAMIPGVSRSGATIAGSLLMGTDKRSAAEFTFFLAMPTMAGAFVYDLYKNIDLVSMDDLMLVAIGFAAAFVMAVVVVKYLLDFVSKHGFAPFAYWRIVVGAVGLVGLFLYTPAPSENNVAAFTSSAEAHTTAGEVEVLEEESAGARLTPDLSSDTTFEHSLTIESDAGKATTRVAKPKRPDDWKVGIKEDRWPLQAN